ncbi:MAG: bifunctional UDP-N-acetylglucosamine diphosphorylase/glucosamine-1-phosphate N-acetyltransferase GlmU [Planctomycetota bacterium]|jgi:bifunctional UDP-N-acetylglucosamine pyrophosphorylase/glucosamine-1-phosphate N-acetyltransferase
MAKRVAIILAAGISSRMKTGLAKVMHKICGREMLAYVLDACRQAGLTKIYVVVGYGAEQVIERFAGTDDIVFVKQDEQKGTGHAVGCCKEHLADFNGDVLVICGDGPLIQTKTLEALIEKHESEQAVATLGTAVLADPTGYGRIVRGPAGNIEGIVEDSDCSTEQKKICEINPSYYLFNSKELFGALEKVKNDNAKKEYYLTDVVGIMIAEGMKVAAIAVVNSEEAVGINDRMQLSQAAKIMQQRIQQCLTEAGVTIVDPDNTWIDAKAKIGADTVIEPFTYIDGEVTIGRDCHIKPFTYLGNGMVVKDGTEIQAGTIKFK